MEFGGDLNTLKKQLDIPRDKFDPILSSMCVNFIKKHERKNSREPEDVVAGIKAILQQFDIYIEYTLDVMGRYEFLSKLYNLVKAVVENQALLAGFMLNYISESVQRSSDSKLQIDKLGQRNYEKCATCSANLARNKVSIAHRDIATGFTDVLGYFMHDIEEVNQLEQDAQRLMRQQGFNFESINPTVQMDTLDKVKDNMDKAILYMNYSIGSIDAFKEKLSWLREQQKCVNIEERESIKSAFDSKKYAWELGKYFNRQLRNIEAKLDKIRKYFKVSQQKSIQTTPIVSERSQKLRQFEQQVLILSADNHQLLNSKHSLENQLADALAKNSLHEGQHSIYQKQISQYTAKVRDLEACLETLRREQTADSNQVSIRISAPNQEKKTYETGIITQVPEEQHENEGSDLSPQSEVTHGRQSRKISSLTVSGRNSHRPRQSALNFFKRMEQRNSEKIKEQTGSGCSPEGTGRSQAHSGNDTLAPTQQVEEQDAEAPQLHKSITDLQSQKSSANSSTDSGRKKAEQSQREHHDINSQPGKQELSATGTNQKEQLQQVCVMAYEFYRQQRAQLRKSVLSATDFQHKLKSLLTAAEDLEPEPPSTTNQTQRNSYLSDSLPKNQVQLNSLRHKLSDKRKTFSRPTDNSQVSKARDGITRQEEVGDSKLMGKTKKIKQADYWLKPGLDIRAIAHESLRSLCENSDLKANKLTENRASGKMLAIPPLLRERTEHEGFDEQDILTVYRDIQNAREVSLLRHKKSGSCLNVHESMLKPEIEYMNEILTRIADAHLRNQPFYHQIKTFLLSPYDLVYTQLPDLNLRVTRSQAQPSALRDSLKRIIMMHRSCYGSPICQHLNYLLNKISSQ